MHQTQKPNPLSFEELRHLYQVEKLTVDQLYGQLLVWIQINNEMAVTLQRHQERYDVELADLTAQVAELKAQPPARSK